MASILGQDLLQFAQLAKAVLQGLSAVSLLSVLAEALIGALDLLFEIRVAHRLECAVQLIVFRVDGAEYGLTHSISSKV